MLIVEVNLDPFGDISHRQVLSKIAIANVGRVYDSFCKHVYLVYEEKPFGGFDPICFRGKIEQYNRIAPVTELLSEVMLDYSKRQKDRVFTEYEIKVLDMMEDQFRMGL